MKCKYCGGDVSLDDHFCQHCGRPVDQAQRHQKEMEQFETEFEETKKEALDRIGVHSGGGTAVGIRLAMICALIVALFAIVIGMDPYNVHQRREKNAAKKNFEAYTAQLDEYLENRDYAAFSAFCRIHELDYNDDFKEYRGIVNAVSHYHYIYRGLQELAFATDKNLSSGYYLNEISKHINSFYEDTGNDYYSRTAEDPERVQTVIDEVEADFKVLLVRYLELTNEEADSLGTLSKSKRTVLIEQALDKALNKATGNSLSDLPQTEPVQTEPSQTEPLQTEPSQTEPLQTEPSQTGSTQPE